MVPQDSLGGSDCGYEFAGWSRVCSGLIPVGQILPSFEERMEQSALTWWQNRGRFRVLGNVEERLSGLIDSLRERLGGCLPFEAIGSSRSRRGVRDHHVIGVNRAR